MARTVREKKCPVQSVKLTEMSHSCQKLDVAIVVLTSSNEQKTSCQLLLTSCRHYQMNNAQYISLPAQPGRRAKKFLAENLSLFSTTFSMEKNPAAVEKYFLYLCAFFFMLKAVENCNRCEYEGRRCVTKSLHCGTKSREAEEKSKWDGLDLAWRRALLGGGHVLGAARVREPLLPPPVHPVRAAAKGGAPPARELGLKHMPRAMRMCLTRLRLRKVLPAEGSSIRGERETEVCTTFIK